MVGVWIGLVGVWVGLIGVGNRLVDVGLIGVGFGFGLVGVWVGLIGVGDRLVGVGLVGVRIGLIGVGVGSACMLTLICKLFHLAMPHNLNTFHPSNMHISIGRKEERKYCKYGRNLQYKLFIWYGIHVSGIFISLEEFQI